MSATNDLVVSELGRASAYLREIASFNRRHELARVLDDPEKRLAYQLTDGTRTSEQIARSDGISKTGRTILNWWKDWEERSLTETTDSSPQQPPRYRYDLFVLNSQEEADHA